MVTLSANTREIGLCGLALLSVWLFRKTDTLRPVILIFAPMAIGFLASVDRLDVSSIHSVADHVQSVMLSAAGK